MLNVSKMSEYYNAKLSAAIFITFSGNCKKALTFYQACFGGTLKIETLEEELDDYTEMPVLNGTLFSDRLIIHGSDLVHNEGRKIGNYISIFLPCKNTYDRKELLDKLQLDKKKLFIMNKIEQKLIEGTDVFDVRWILGI